MSAGGVHFCWYVPRFPPPGLPGASPGLLEGPDGTPEVTFRAPGVPSMANSTSFDPQKSFLGRSPNSFPAHCRGGLEDFGRSLQFRVAST